MKKLGAILVLVIAFVIAWYDYVFQGGALMGFLEGYAVLVILIGMMLGIFGIARWKT